MSKQIEFFFDVGSPAAYLASTQLPLIARQTGAQILYRPMLLGGVFAATKNASPVSIPAKGAYMLRDLNRFASKYGVSLNFSPHFPINTLMLMRLLSGVQSQKPERFLPLLTQILDAMWVQALNLGDQEVLANILDQGEMEVTEAMSLVQDESVKARLKEQTSEAVARGVFGAPTFFVGSEMFWGQDRLDFVRAAVETSS